MNKKQIEIFFEEFFEKIDLKSELLTWVHEIFERDNQNNIEQIIMKKMAPNTKIKKEIVVAEIAKQLWDNCQALDKYMTDNGIFYGLGSIDTSPNDQLWEEIVEKHLTAMIEELKEKLVVNVNDI